MGAAALQLRKLLIRSQNILRRRFKLEVHAFRPEPPGCNVLALAISDVVLRRVMAGHGTDLTFLQIGASDGITGDPIHEFVVRYGFRGVCLEPQPEAFARLEATYREQPSIRCVQAALAASDGTMPLYRFRPGPNVPEWAHMLASFSREVLADNFFGIRSEIESLAVATISAQTLRARYKLDAVDLVQIDTEGFDFEIIKLLDLGSFRPTIIHFEAAVLLPADRQACYAYLAEHGYSVTPNGPDAVAYLEPATQIRIPVPEAPEAFRLPTLGQQRGPDLRAARPG
jgi:FkbM family methyltransferase